MVMALVVALLPLFVWMAYEAKRQHNERKKTHAKT